jgi:hypothetical protein
MTNNTTRKPPRRRFAQMTLLVSGAAIAMLAAIPALSASASPVMAKPAVAAALSPAAVNGAYTLHYSWGCTSHYNDTSITFNAAAGTFVTGDGGNGIFGQANDDLFWQYTPNRTTYGGTIDGSVGSGASSTTSGANGCWYLTASGTTGAPRHAEAPDSAGNGH